MRIPRPAFLCWGLSGFLILVSASASAQISSDAVPRARLSNTKNAVERDVEQRRFRLGPVRLIPVLDIKNAGYDSNVFGLPAGHEIGAGTISIWGGFRWIVPTGPKLYFVGEALPAYTWYNNIPALTFFGGNYSAYLLGFFNRVSISVGGFSAKELAYVSSEAQSAVIETVLNGSVKLEVQLARRLSITGNVQVQRLRFGQEIEAPIFIDTNQFERTEGAAGAGVRYTFSPALAMSAGYEKTRTEFVFVPRLSDNQSDAFLIGVHYDRPRFYLNLAGGYRRGEPWNGSSFTPYKTPTGGLFASWYLTKLIELQGYGDRRVTYGILRPQFIQTRYGGGIHYLVRDNILLRFSSVWGTNVYGATGGPEGVPKRTDYTLDYGGGFSAIVYRGVVLTATATESRYGSTLAELDRKVVRFITSISFGGVLTR